MARHRNVRGMAKNYEEYDDYDGVYGQSVEDDHCISPRTAAEFMYDRGTQNHSMAAYFESNEDELSDDLEVDSAQDGGGAWNSKKRADSFAGHKPELSQTDEAILRSCIEEIQNVVGETVPESTLVNVILEHKFNVESALNALLDSQGSCEKPQPQRIRKERGGRRKVADNRNVEEPVTKDVDRNELISDLCGRMVFDINTPREPEIDKSAFVSNQESDASEEISNSDVLMSKEEAVVSAKAESLEKSSQEEEDSSSPVEKDSKSAAVTATPQTAKAKSSDVDPVASYERQRGSSKPLINLVVIGHVDAGKSTLMGHLLYKLGCVSKKILHRYEQDSKKLGKASFMYAWVLDETSEERTRGITMDVAQSKFETPNRTVTLLDAPGHKDFIPNMITGAAEADVALLVVDATRGEFETGFEAGGQTREHTLLIRSLGVSQLAVVVNKLDNVDWLQDRYEEIKTKLGAFLKQAGFRDSDITFVPCSGLTGENLTERSQNAQLQRWYDGPCLVEVIDNFKAPERLLSKPFRMCISDVFKGMGSGFSVSGKIESGSVQNGDRRLVMPAGEPCVVKGVIMDETAVPEAFAGDHVTLNLTGLDMANVTAGSVVCDPNYPIPVTTSFRARVVIFNISVPITKGFPVVLHYQSMCEQAVVKKLLSQLNKSTGEVIRKKPRCLTKNSSGVIQLEVGRPICVELYKDYRDLGRFMLRSGGTTIAAGLVVEIL